MKEFKKIKNELRGPFWTDDYGIFNTRKCNRDVIAPNVKKVYDSIMKFGWWKTDFIICGEGLTVLDGQNRIAALKRVYAETGEKYKIGYWVYPFMDEMEKIITLQTNRSGWKPGDYAKSYSEQGYESYARFIQFRKDFAPKFPHSVALVLALDDKMDTATKDFRDGKFKVNNDNWGVIYEKGRKIEDVLKYYKYANHRTFVRAYNYMLSLPEFNHLEFAKKLNVRSDMLNRVANWWEYIDQIEKLYNFKRSNKVRFIKH